MKSKATKAINTINTLTPEERRELVERPFPVVTVSSQKSWRGFIRGEDMLNWSASNHLDKFNRGAPYDEAFLITRGGSNGRETE